MTTLSPSEPKPVFPSDLQPLTPQDHAAAKEVVRQVLALVEARDREAHALNPATDLPAGNWNRDNEHNDFLEAYRHVAEANYEVINNLRYYTNTFTGYKLIHFRHNKGFASVMPMPEDVKATIRENLPRLESLVRTYRHIKEIIPPRLLIQPYRGMGEVGADVEGVVVNNDTVRQQCTLATLWRLGVPGHLRRQVRRHGTAHVVEIGGGYGSLCLYLKRLIPKLTYTLIDLPEALLFSGIYLTVAAGAWKPELATPSGPPPVTPSGVHLVPNYQSRQMLDRLPRVDLALNISSFGEMAPCQVENYAKDLSARMRKGGMLFECNEQGNPHIRSDVPAILSEHFTYNQPAHLPEIPIFEGAARLHANVPIKTQLSLTWWERLRARPFRELPKRILGRLLKRKS